MLLSFWWCCLPTRPLGGFAFTPFPLWAVLLWVVLLSPLGWCCFLPPVGWWCTPPWEWVLLPSPAACCCLPPPPRPMRRVAFSSSFFWVVLLSSASLGWCCLFLSTWHEINLDNLIGGCWFPSFLGWCSFLLLSCGCCNRFFLLYIYIYSYRRDEIKLNLINNVTTFYQVKLNHI